MRLFFNSKERFPISVYIIALVCGGVFLLAGLLKAKDVTALYPALLYDGVSSCWLFPLSISIIAIELFAGSILLSCYCCRFALILLFIFTAQLVYFLIGGDPPECGCFGKLLEAKLSNQTAIFLGIVRNSALMTLMGYALQCVKKPLINISRPSCFLISFPFGFKSLWYKTQARLKNRT